MTQEKLSSSGSHLSLREFKTNQDSKIPMQNSKPSIPQNPQPVHKIRHGAVSANVWRNETEMGPMFNVTFQRSYREGEEWKNSISFGRKDLLVLGLIAARSFEWIGSQPKNGNATSRSKGGNPA
jgi:hypothetical protein